ncbi:MAG: hypothetical protein JNJ83_06805 [Verrucomicrobiaceae bacterium]|nr:hypothetical protein [Verrucomicrobiaceae bacterium]
MSRLLLTFISLPLIGYGQCSVEGMVPLPKSKAAPVMAKRYEIVSKGGVMSLNPPLAVVYIEGVFPPAQKPDTRQIIQKDFMFTPALLPVRVGTKVEFPNLDDAYHNVFSFSPSKRFDLGRYRADERPIPFQVFDKPGIVSLRCDIHEHMRGIILVLDTPHFVVSEPSGQFRLTGVPAGSYRVKAWVNSRTTLVQDVVLKPGKATRADFAKP